MIKLDENDIKTNTVQSSKGNQMKWYFDKTWYKADYTGYEGFAEYVISNLLKFSNLKGQEYTEYDSVEIEYSETNFLGCKSKDFLPKGWQLITLERLFISYYGQSLHKNIFSIESYENRIKFLVEQTIRMTNLEDFGEYMSKLLAIDAIFLNEDRHTHNIAVLLDNEGNYHYCPIFDNGASLLSDTKVDYPMNKDIFLLMKKVKSKTFCDNFDDQLDTIEKVYGRHMKFNFNKKNVEEIIDNNSCYSKEVKERVKNIIFNQMRKYQYMFVK